MLNEIKDEVELGRSQIRKQTDGQHRELGRHAGTSEYKPQAAVMVHLAENQQSSRRRMARHARLCVLAEDAMLGG